jgi:AcrR family transcriptional regulator
MTSRLGPTRGQPGATQRLVVAAVELFTEQGYDATTVAQIAALTDSHEAVESPVAA